MPDDSDTASVPPATPPAEETPRAPLALFVDPDADAAQPLADAVRDLCDVMTVGTAAAALAVLHGQAPALLVTELDLPDQNGLELLAAVRALPSAAGMLVLVVTAKTATETKIAAFDAGADDVLVKPVAADDFRIHVRMLTRFRQILGD